MFEFLIVLMFLHPNFWLPDQEFDQRYQADRVGYVQRNENHAARAAFELSRIDPGSPAAARLREGLDVYLQRAARNRQELDKNRAAKRLEFWNRALIAAGRRIR